MALIAFTNYSYNYNYSPVVGFGSVDLSYHYWITGQLYLLVDCAYTYSLHPRTVIFVYCPPTLQLLNMFYTWC